MTRSSMLEVLRQDYVQTARAKGLAERGIYYTHALRNALLPVVTVVGLQFGTLLGGAVLTESVFGWPGIGQLLQVATDRGDPRLLVWSLVSMIVVISLLNRFVWRRLYAAASVRFRIDA